MPDIYCEAKDCVFNRMNTCTADAVQVSSGEDGGPVCLSYSNGEEGEVVDLTPEDLLGPETAPPPVGGERAPRRTGGIPLPPGMMT